MISTETNFGLIETQIPSRYDSCLCPACQLLEFGGSHVKSHGLVPVLSIEGAWLGAMASSTQVVYHFIVRYYDIWVCKE